MTQYYDFVCVKAGEPWPWKSERYTYRSKDDNRHVTEFIKEGQKMFVDTYVLRPVSTPHASSRAGGGVCGVDY